MDARNRDLFDAIVRSLRQDWGAPDVFDDLNRVTTDLARARSLCGLEPEGWARTACGNAFDIARYLKDHPGSDDAQIDLPSGFLTHDGGFDHAELGVAALPFHRAIAGLRQLEREALQALPTGSRIVWQDRRPAPADGEPSRWNDVDTRHNTLADALRLECRLRGLDESLVDSVFHSEMKERASGHIHVGGIEQLGQVGVGFLNLGTNWATVITHVVCRQFGLPPNRNNIFNGWADERRLPAPRYFRDGAAVRDFLTGIPRLLSPGNDRPNLQSPGGMDRNHLKCIWHLVRVSHLGTLELRLFPALPPDDLEPVLWLVTCFLWAVLTGRGQEFPRIDDATWWHLL